jgi:ubiquinone/menaquinone biosynthesis C-methylase UbiE
MFKNKKKTASEISTDHHNNMSDHFKKNYAHYDQDKYYNAFTYGRSKIDKELIKLIKNLPKNSKVLDLGCGTGDQLNILKRFNMDFYGVDPAPGMVEIAKQKFDIQDKIKIGSAQKIPFENNYFDCLIMIEVLRYFDKEDINMALEESFRVLKPGGKLFCTFVNKWSLDFFYIFQTIRQLLKKNKFDEKNPYCEFFEPKKVFKIYNDLNFKNIEIIGNMFSPLRVAYKINRKFGRYLSIKLDKFDDKISNKKFFKMFSGHLIGIGEKD